VPAAQATLGWTGKSGADHAVTRIARVAQTPQTLAQAMAQDQRALTAGAHHPAAGNTASAGATQGPEFDDTHHSALQAAALLRQAVVSFTAGGSANLAPTQGQDASEKATLSTGHVGH
jgi:hypothetical protein